MHGKYATGHLAKKKKPEQSDNQLIMYHEVSVSLLKKIPVKIRSYKSDNQTTSAKEEPTIPLPDYITT